MITNKRVKEIQELTKKAKARRETALFIAEGERLIKEVPKELIRELYVTEDFAENTAGAYPGAEIITPQVMERLSDTKTPQGILAVVRKPSFDREKILGQQSGLFLILETLQDPGNLGTIFRSAEGAGVTALFYNRETADLYAPKTVRSTMGSIFRVPHFETAAVMEAAELLKHRGVTLYAAHLKGACRYDEPDYRKAAAFLIGNEGNGLTEEAAGLSDTRIRIPMAGRLESLNAGVAASLLLYEAARQRGFSN